MVEENAITIDPKDSRARARAVRLKNAGKTRPTITVKDKSGHVYEVAEVDFDPTVHTKVAAAPEAPAAEAEEPDAGEGDGGGGGGEAPAGDAPVLAEDHDELNAGELIERIGNLDDAEAVAAIKAYEEANKKRKTVIHAADERIAELEDGDG